MGDDDRQLPSTDESAGVATDVLFGRIVEIIDGARGRVARAANTAMVQAYWAIGQEIVEIDQAGEHRAGYGCNVLHELSIRLTTRFGAGFTESALRRMVPAQPRTWVSRADPRLSRSIAI
ncbi:MAG: hypothetical protein IPM94_14310 [bacterium]|nr:hypothetical protein [bacterium]